MANTGRILTGTAPRLLQYGLDKIVDHFSNLAPSVHEAIFNKRSTDKGFYEYMSLAGMGMAGRKGESEAISYDSVNQEWNARYPIYTYEKSARISMEAQEDNVYKNMMELIGKACVKAQKDAKDYQAANIFNNSTSTLWADGVALLSTAHPTQAGPTYSNRLSPDVALSEDSLEECVKLIDNFVNSDGLKSDWRSQKLLVPVGLKYVAERIWGSKYRTSTTDNDINASMSMGDLVARPIVWKRLSSQTAWYVTSDCEGLVQAERKGLKSQVSQDPYTFDTIYTTHARYTFLNEDSRCVAGTAGA